MDKTLSDLFDLYRWDPTGMTILSQSGFGSNDNEEVLDICQISRIGTAPSDAV